ncbi:t-SNARE [Saitoella complicata NRRL Y-17804]|nr:t-SNARE [Saitoella complicata NRRL Y-17804]ODQ51160.1 t-SNARE [Saitoella complicata NRRL Y-17804]
MSRDRLAGMRTGGAPQAAQSYPNQADFRTGAYPPQQDNYAPIPTNPYGDNQGYPAQAGGHGQDAYAAQQPQNGGYEMQNMEGNGANSMADFFAEIDQIKGALRQIDENVTRIQGLHQRSLNDITEDKAEWNHRQLDALIADTSTITNNLKFQIKNLEAKNARLPAGSSDVHTRSTQTAAVKNNFLKTIQNYQKVEQEFRQRYRQRMERQYRIVNPEASDVDVSQALDTQQGGQIFSQALLNSNRQGEARSALREVQARHEDILRIEKTIGELAQLFNEMSILVEQQEAPIAQIEVNAENTQKDTELGLEHTDKAVKSARAARRKKWYCLLITLLILAIVGLVLGLVFGLRK